MENAKRRYSKLIVKMASLASASTDQGWSIKMMIGGRKMDKISQNVICYISVDEMDSTRSEYMKRRKLNQLKALLDRLGVVQKKVYIDEGFEVSAWEKPHLKEIVNSIEKKEFSIFIAISIFDLGNNFLDSIEFIKHLVENNIRVICIDNNIDSAYSLFLNH